MRNELLDEIERLIRRDPARRGLIASEETRGPLCAGHLAIAAADLAQRGKRVAIVTGFFIPSATPPAAETDGPPGAALLGAALASIGIDVQFITDEPCRQAMEIAAKAMGFARSAVATAGNTPAAIDAWYNEIARSHFPLTHLIAIERVGPSHTRESILRQTDRRTDAQSAIQAFDRSVAIAEQDHCYNMRGTCLDAYTAPLHRLFELAESDPNVKTIGIGDGGNEIGMGNIDWQELRERLTCESAAKIPCRIRTSWTIVAGVSNWGGMALAAATLLLRNQTQNLTDWNSGQQQLMLAQMVNEGPAVDGITRLPEPSVDGLPFLTYIQPWIGIRRVLGLTNDDTLPSSTA